MRGRVGEREGRVRGRSREERAHTVMTHTSVLRQTGSLCLESAGCLNYLSAQDTGRRKGEGGRGRGGLYRHQWPYIITAEGGGVCVDKTHVTRDNAGKRHEES